MLACGNPSDGRAQAHGLRLVSYLARVQGDLNGAASAGEAYLALARQSGDPLELAWALSGLARTAWLRGHYERGRLLVTEALPRFEAAGQAVGTGWSYITLGQLAHHQGELAQARRHFEAAGAAFRRQGYPEGIGEVLYSLGLVDLDEGDLQQARARLQAALEIAEALNNELRVGEVRNRLGELSRRAGDLATARHQYQDSIVLARKSDDATGLASALAGMARVLVEEGERSTVWSVLDEALGLARAVDNTRFEARVLTSRGELERAEGRPGRAQHWHLQSLKLRRARGERIGMAENLVFLSVLALDHGNPRMAADLFSVADRLWAATGMQLSGSEATAAEHVRAVLGPLRLAQARAALASVSLDQLVDEVLAGGHIAAAAAPGTAQLTPREQEVLSEIAAGRTNREIAEDLVLSIRTVERHVASIYAKVGASGRAARALATAVALVGTVHGAAQADEMRAGTHPPRLGSP
jgi:non-specific serine/threonine protein kinase